MEHDMDFAGKVAVIAGATGGLGKIVTQELAQQGARLVLLGRSQDKLESLVDELGLADGEPMLFAGSLHQLGTLNETAKTVMDTYGRIDLLLNLVGGWTGGQSLEEVPANAVQNMIDQHLWTTFYLTQAFIPSLKQGSSGRVIVVSSPTATQPGAKTAPYAIGKAAQEALMLTLAKELEGSGATANVIQVKAIDTAHRRESDTTGKYADWTTPEEISAAILYLCSEQARMINGVRIPITG